jgi:hypothetical protein
LRDDPAVNKHTVIWFFDQGSGLLRLCKLAGNFVEFRSITHANFALRFGLHNRGIGSRFVAGTGVSGGNVDLIPDFVAISTFSLKFRKSRLRGGDSERKLHVAA